MPRVPRQARSPLIGYIQPVVAVVVIEKGSDDEKMPG